VPRSSQGTAEPLTVSTAHREQFGTRLYEYSTPPPAPVAARLYAQTFCAYACESSSRQFLVTEPVLRTDVLAPRVVSVCPPTCVDAVLRVTASLFCSDTHCQETTRTRAMRQ
jgi:hypothetical protein